MQTLGPCLRKLAEIAAILVVATALTACASTSGPLATNSIRDDLNRGGDKVSKAERRFEFGLVQHLSEDVPVCIAYRMPASPPWATESFKDALAAVGRAAKQWKLELRLQAQLLHSRFEDDTGAAFPAELSLRVSEVLRSQFPGIGVKYEPIDKARFRERANCGKKDTVFVDRERLTSYSKDFPSDLSWSGEVHIGDVMFIRIGSRHDAAVASARSE